MKWIILQLRKMNITNLIVYLGLFWSASAVLYLSTLWHTGGDFMFTHVSILETVGAGVLVILALTKFALRVRRAAQ